MSNEPADDDPASFIIEGLEELRGYTQQQPATLAEIYALLESFKQRLVVPVGRVEEFQQAVRAAGLDGRLTVLGHPSLEPDQAYLMQSEAEFEADMQAAIEKGLQEQMAAEMTRTRAYLNWAQTQRMIQQYMPQPQPPWLGIITGL